MPIPQREKKKILGDNVMQLLKLKI
jgi:hypothetical protein